MVLKNSRKRFGTFSEIYQNKLPVRQQMKFRGGGSCILSIPAEKLISTSSEFYLPMSQGILPSPFIQCRNCCIIKRSSDASLVQCFTDWLKYNLWGFQIAFSHEIEFSLSSWTDEKYQIHAKLPGLMCQRHSAVISCFKNVPGLIQRWWLSENLGTSRIQWNFFWRIQNENF